MLDQDTQNKQSKPEKTDSLLYRLFNRKKAIEETTVLQETESKQEISEHNQIYLDETDGIGDSPSPILEDIAQNKEEIASEEVGTQAKEEEHQTGEPVDAKVELNVASDRMLATVFIYPPKFGGKDVTVPEIAGMLKSAKVTCGILEDTLSDIAEKKLYLREITVARGIEAVDGVNGEIKEFFSRTKEIKFEPKEDGKIDFKNLNIVNNIKADTVICEIIPPVQGSDGMNVAGTVVRAIRGKDAVVPKGENTKLSEDKTKLLATCDGHLEYARNAFHVKNIFEVVGNVDNSVGNIDFCGDVNIQGDVFEGYEIRCKGNIVVRGMVEGASIYAGGSITLVNGINGMRKGILESGKGITSKFIENCTIRARETILAESVINSTVFCDDKLIVTSKKGVIVGGCCTVFRSVEANTIGTQSNLVTTIILGATPTIIAERKELMQKITQLHEEMETIKKNTAYLDKCAQTGRVSPERQEIYQQLAKMKIIATMNEAKIKKRLEEIDQIIEEASGSTVSCRTVYPPTKITIGNASTTVQSVHERCTFYNNHEGEIKVRYK